MFFKKKGTNEKIDKETKDIASIIFGTLLSLKLPVASIIKLYGNLNAFKYFVKINNQAKN